MESTIEILKPVEGYEGLYAVNNLGEVWSLGNEKTKKTKRLKPGKERCGYLHVRLAKDGKYRNLLVHRLVAQAFIDNPYNLPQVNHKDEDKTNNRVENLEWCDASHNCNHGTRNERLSEKHIGLVTWAKPVFQYTLAGEFIKEWESTCSIERELGYNNSHISACCNGNRKQAYGYVWRYIKNDDLQ